MDFVFVDGDTLLSLILISLFPIGITAACKLLRKYTPFGKLGYWKTQIIIGVVFGFVAIFATSNGVPLTDGAGNQIAIINVRDAAPLSAGLVFGWPAGIISGVIGGIQRFAVGGYTQIACSVATVSAGVFAAFLRKFFFDNKRCSWYHGLVAAIVSEVFHMLLVILTHYDDLDTALAVVEGCTLYMLVTTAIAVTGGIIVANIIGDGIHRERVKKLSVTFQKWILITVVGAFIFSIAFLITIQYNVCGQTADMLMVSNITDVKEEIQEQSDETLLDITKLVAYDVGNAGNINDITTERLQVVCDKYGVAEINLVDENGIITKSSVTANIGYDMASGEQSAEFLCLLRKFTEKGELVDEYVQEYGLQAMDPSLYRKYAGKQYQGGFIQVGYGEEEFTADLGNQVQGITRHRHLDAEGYMMICDSKGVIVSDVVTVDENGKESTHEGENITSVITDIRNGVTNDDVSDFQVLAKNQKFNAVVKGVQSRCMYVTSEGYTILAVYPEESIAYSVKNTAYLSTYLEVIIYAVIFAVIYLLIRKFVVNSMGRINKSLAIITSGNLDEKVSVRHHYEFESLSDDINKTVAKLKQYIADAEARIDKELAFAKGIQEASLPSVYPKNNDIDMYACMDTAKEVGGDFYDFYMLDEKHMAFLIADVSGKGIPAAMFMMTSKTLLNSLCETGLPVDEVVTQANDKLCESNEQGMFLTLWMAIVNLETGLVEYANAGHNPPVIIKADGTVEYIRTRPGFVLAGMEGVRYKKFELQLEPGDSIYLYTDGITEATNASEELYGEDRLLKAVRKAGSVSAVSLCTDITADVAKFVNGAPQADDMTMLAFKYKCEGFKEKVNVLAKIENIEAVTTFINEQLERAEASMKAQTQIDIAVDEIFSNIAHYAYAGREKAGRAEIEFELRGNVAEIIFSDWGDPFNPLERDDPDVTLSAESREIGGLGIFMVKKSMDDVIYTYEDGKNSLKLIKTIK